MEKIGILFRATSEKCIKDNIKLANAAFIIKYSGVNSPDLSLLRQKLRESASTLLVVKNSIARRALKASGRESISTLLEGPCGIVFTKDDPVSASRVLFKFSKEHESLRLEGGFFADKILTKKDLETLASLPSKEILRGKAVMILKSPLFGIVGVLNQVLSKLVYCLEQIRQKKTKIEG